MSSGMMGKAEYQHRSWKEDNAPGSRRDQNGIVHLLEHLVPLPMGSAPMAIYWLRDLWVLGTRQSWAWKPASSGTPVTTEEALWWLKVAGIKSLGNAACACDFGSQSCAWVGQQSVF